MSKNAMISPLSMAKNVCRNGFGPLVSWTAHEAKPHDLRIELHRGSGIEGRIRDVIQPGRDSRHRHESLLGTDRGGDLARGSDRDPIVSYRCGNDGVERRQSFVVDPGQKRVTDHE